MTKSDFLHILADAVQVHEGWLRGTGKAWPNFNPGNLHMEGQPGASGAIGSEAKFGNFYDGKQAQLNDLGAKLDAGLRTIRAIITRYAPPDSNDTEAYIASVLAFFSARNVDIPADYDIPTALEQFNRPIILIAVNELYDPEDFAAIQALITQVAKYMPEYAFSCRYSNEDLSQSITTSTGNPFLAPFNVIAGQKTKTVLAAYNEGQVLNAMIYDGLLMLGKKGVPAGGCEYQGVTIDPVSAVSSVFYNGANFTEPVSRALFHELIHELFSVTGQPDTLHAYLVGHGGYTANLASDLLAVFNGANLNNATAVANLKRSL